MKQSGMQPGTQQAQHLSTDLERNATFPGRLAARFRSNGMRENATATYVRLASGAAQDLTTLLAAVKRLSKLRAIRMILVMMTLMQPHAVNQT